MVLCAVDVPPDELGIPELECTTECPGKAARDLLSKTEDEDTFLP